MYKSIILFKEVFFGFFGVCVCDKFATIHHQNGTTDSYEQFVPHVIVVSVRHTVRAEDDRDKSENDR